jgi:hypothetical protein
MYITTAIVGAARRGAAREVRAGRRGSARSRAQRHAPTLCTRAARRTEAVRRHRPARTAIVVIH